MTSPAPPALRVATIVVPQKRSPGDTCATPHVSPRLLARSPFSLPPDAVPNEEYRDVRILVHLDATGKVTSAAIFQKSGAPKFDAAALSAARLSRYAPEIAHCRPVPSGYIYIVEYGSGTPAPLPHR